MAEAEVLPDLQAALICEDVRLEVTGFNTLIGVMNIMPIPSVPFHIIKLCVFTRWVNGNGSFTQTVRFLTPNEEEEIAMSQTRFELSENDTHTTNISFFGGFQLKEFGDYPVEILMNGDLKLRITMRVVHIPH